MTDIKLRPAALKAVEINGGFWGKRTDVNRSATLPVEYDLCKSTGRIDAFRQDWKPGEPGRPHQYWDSDVAKWVEATAYSLATHPDEELAGRLDEVIKLIVSAQQDDGYLNSYYTTIEPEKPLDLPHADA